VRCHAPFHGAETGNFQRTSRASFQNNDGILFGTKCVDRCFIRRQEIHCVFEYPNKRDLTLFAFAFGVAGCLMVWTINLSIDRLLDSDGDRKVLAPVESHVQSPLQDPRVCRGKQIEMPRTAVTTNGSADAIEQCHTAELEP